MTEAHFWYPASISQIVSVNDSFDSCMLRVCYAGVNRNKTIISKEAIEKAIPTMAYCPLVANYDVASDTIGGHDVDFVDTDSGLKMVNMTDAVGVVPENPEWRWETVTEADGTVNEYLSTPAILWKRTPVYEKLKADGVSGQSMEIRINKGKVVDSMFQIDAFEFTAFCLLGEGIEPCFESAQVGMFSVDKVGSRLHEMMADFKREFSTVITASADDINLPPKGEKNSLKGGEGSLEKYEELLKKYGLVAEDVTFEPDGMTDEEIEAKFAEIKAAKFADEGSEAGGETGDAGDGEQGGEQENEGDDAGDGDDAEGGQSEGEGQGSGGEADPQEDDDDDAPVERRRQFSLTGEQMWNEIMDSLNTVMITDEWGSWPRYNYTDYDPAAMEIYAYDNEDWNLYGFKYTLNGDKVVIDFDSKTRKKLAFVDYDNGSDAQFNYKHMMDSAEARFAAVAAEVANLRTFKQEAEKAEHRAKAEEVFAQFADLAEDERFKALKDGCEAMSIQDIEDKCFAIRGRNMQMKFSVNTKPVRLPVEHGASFEVDEPYGGLFVEYGVGNHE